MINYCVRQLAVQIRAPEHVRTSLEYQITRHAEQTFIWAALVISLLEQSPRRSLDCLNRIILEIPDDLGALIAVFL